MKGGLRSALGEGGAQCAMMGGALMTPLWCADNLDSVQKVSVE